ncbi:class I SAM-dependent methyltransferase [Methylobacterium sp. NMS14P]|uniref:class I SAM-dependent methyltransferase n=1 Tax=Methylobacterium sp. NMS14P TaxID=2894310 RepID=UPI0023591A9F|nr:methyltransferase domain-containing protein [Methylobacterium sp. NMS14P]WCS26439.1 class I SAM-dependent methyltransferase [Methylobacterium sp. NMS14P]
MYEPVNYRSRSRADIEKAAVRAIEIYNNLYSIALSYVQKPISGLKILEIGPGSDFGPQLLLASQGASVIVADRFLARWYEDYHRPLYETLLRRWDGPADALKRCLADGGYANSGVQLLEEPAEDLSSIATASIDLITSFAVLEHISDLSAVVRELSRVSVPGAISYHGIDMRYHAFFERPLEHLIPADDEFLRVAEPAFFEMGNRIRSSEFWAAFEAEGLEVVARIPTSVPEEAYFQDALPRIRTGRSSYRLWPENDLRIDTAAFVLRRDEAGSEMVRERGRSARDLIAALKDAAVAKPPNEADDPHVFIDIDCERVASSGGFSWVYQLSQVQENDGSHGRWSEMQLFEDDRPLGPSHTPHVEIQQRGAGRFTHWRHELYFATSDNSDPKSNGRRYVVKVQRSSLKE